MEEMSMNLTRTARATGLWYLGLALTGLFGFLIIRPRLFAAGDAAATLANLVDQAPLARVGVALELGVVLTQALTAVWFYRLFRGADPLAAAGIAAFGLVNAIAILGSAALLGTAVELAQEPFGDAASSVQTLYLISGNLWDVANLFFGLWLMPMGLCVLRSRWMPRPLGFILIGGGVGYVLSGFLRYLVPGTEVLDVPLALPASVGEFWMIGYLLIRGVRRTVAAPESVPAPV
jgi:hypothetical protein